MRKKWFVIGAVAVVGVVLLGVGLFFIFGGVFNVAATASDSRLVVWLLSTVSDNSVRVRAKKIQAPSDLASADRIDGGMRHYHKLCLTCHGAPGVKRSPIGSGLNPEPPDLVEAAQELSPSETFWVIKNGIKMTGMPAFGPKLQDERLWDIVAFVDQFPKITPEQYKKMLKETGLTPTPEESE